MVLDIHLVLKHDFFPMAFLDFVNHLINFMHLVHRNPQVWLARGLTLFLFLLFARTTHFAEARLRTVLLGWVQVSNIRIEVWQLLDFIVI